MEMPNKRRLKTLKTKTRFFLKFYCFYSFLKKVKNTQDLGKNTQTAVKTTLIKKLEID
jgi:hypothetical protein